MFAKPFFAGFLVALAAASASAGVVTDVLVSPGTELAVPFVNKFSVANFDMNGMKVTAFFNNIPTESGTWSGNQASNTNFQLSESGDTFFSAWTLNNLSQTALLTKLVIEGKPGFTVFDLQGPTFKTVAGSVLPSGNADATEGTTDSERGYTFEWSNAANIANLNVTATYSDIVRLNAAASPIGDIWSTLTIDFGAAPADWQDRTSSVRPTPSSSSPTPTLGATAQPPPTTQSPNPARSACWPAWASSPPAAACDAAADPAASHKPQPS